MKMPAKTPAPPYYAVIFTSIRTKEDAAGYDATAGKLAELAASMPGFLGAESVRDADGFGLTVSYWDSEEAIGNWKRNAQHQDAWPMREQWYDRYELRVCRVERASRFPDIMP